MIALRPVMHGAAAHRAPDLHPTEGRPPRQRSSRAPSPLPHLSNRVFRSYEDILDHCCAAWNKLIDQPWRIMSIGLRDWAHGCRSMGLGISLTFTPVELRDGQSFAVAGLLQSINQETQEQLPWLAEVPIIGTLFRSAAFERKETDLAIIVTPRLVRPARPGQRLKTPLDNTAPANDLDLFLNGRQEVSVAKARVAGTAPLPPTG